MVQQFMIKQLSVLFIVKTCIALREETHAKLFFRESRSQMFIKKAFLRIS